MKITSVEPFILHVPVTRDDIADSTHRISHWGAPGVIIRTDTGIAGCGYSGTHAHLESDRLIAGCIGKCFAPLLLERDPLETGALWDRLAHHGPLQWVGRGGIVHLALGAVDIALWDIKAKAAGLPLWKLLGGGGDKKVAAYNTDSGWLNWPVETLVGDAKRLVEEEGYRAVKIKIGSPEIRRDLGRIEAVRRALGDNIAMMVDANGKFDLPTAMQIGNRLRDFDITWFEEPIWYDDVQGHAALARAIDTPIALGEQLYRLDDFRNFIHAGGVQYVQPDVVRLAGVTEWWQTADLALAYRLPVVAHIGDMMQVQLHLSFAHPACRMLEFIPWMRDCFEEPATVRDGYFVRPEMPGAGTTLKAGIIEQFTPASS